MAKRVRTGKIYFYVPVMLDKLHPPISWDNVTCESCGLCAWKDRDGLIIGFPAHGASKRKATLVTIESGKGEK